MTSEESKDLLKPHLGSLIAICTAAKEADQPRNYIPSKTTIANGRHDAMVHAAKRLLKGFETIDDCRTTRFICPSRRFALSFKKIGRDGTVQGVKTKTNKRHKTLGQLTLPGLQSTTLSAIPLFYVGYEVDEITYEIVAFRVSMYLDGRPWFAYDLQELEPLEVPVNTETKSTNRKTTIHVKDGKSSRGGEGQNATGEREN